MALFDSSIKEVEAQGEKLEDLALQNAKALIDYAAAKFKATLQGWSLSGSVTLNPPSEQK